MLARADRLDRGPVRQFDEPDAAAAFAYQRRAPARAGVEHDRALRTRRGARRPHAAIRLAHQSATAGRAAGGARVVQRDNRQGRRSYPCRLPRRLDAARAR